MSLRPVCHRDEAWLVRPRNARRLLDAMENLESGRGTVRPLTEDE